MKMIQRYYIIVPEENTEYKLFKSQYKCVPNRVLLYCSMTFCSINSASSVFTLKIPKRKSTL